MYIGRTLNQETNDQCCWLVISITGVYCEKELNECESEPCLNGGTCVDLKTGYSCKCVDGYTGMYNVFLYRRFLLYVMSVLLAFNLTWIRLTCGTQP